MKNEQFNKIVSEQLERCTNILCSKAKEYATEDRLHNFKVAAALQGLTPRQALAGMMAKHSVSIYDMATSTEQFSMAMWEEKITDHMNYLLLLKAIIEEERNEQRGVKKGVATNT
jgi:hypothetical protein